VAADGAHLRGSLARLVDQIGRSRSGPIEEQSHHPEILYRYGAPDAAYDQMMDLARADRTRREYPEVSFSVVGAMVTGLMGVGVDPVTPGREAAPLDYFANQFVMTLPQLTAKTAWAELRHLPVRANDLTIRHDGVTATVFTNNRGPALVWRAAFPGRFDALVVNGVRVKATRVVLPPGREVSVARVVVAPGASAKVEVPRQ
jgi:putative transposon-encoded protein